MNCYPNAANFNVPAQAFYWHSNSQNYNSKPFLDFVSSDINSAIVSLFDQTSDTAFSTLFLDATQFNISFLGI